MPGEGFNRGLRHGDVTGVPSNPAIRQLTVQEAQGRPGDPQECPLQHSAAPQGTQRPRNPAQQHWPRCFQSSNMRKIIFLWWSREAPHPPQLLLLALDFIASCQGREVGSGTFNGAPLGLPPKDSSSIHLVLLVTAHHCKWDHFLWKEKNKAVISSENWPGNQTSEQSPTSCCCQGGFMG